ncbi:Myb/SANT-like transcription factor, partial [Oryctes borbonicus]
KLVTVMASCPCIYDCRSKDYKNSKMKENSWKKISMAVGRHEGECKKRWRSIKDNYLKIRNSLKISANSGREGKRIKWYLYDHLKFLGAVKYRRRPLNSIEKKANCKQEASEMDDTNSKDLEDKVETKDMHLDGTEDQVESPANRDSVQTSDDEIDAPPR